MSFLNNTKLSISPIAWTNDDDPTLGGDTSFERCISDMAIAGYTGTELGSKYPKDGRVLKQALSQKNLVLSSAWFSSFFTDPNSYHQTIDDFYEQASFLKLAGANIINVCECAGSIQQTNKAIFGEAKPIFSDIQWLRLFDGLHTIGRIANEMGMQLSYHFHLGTGVQTEAEIQMLMDNTSPNLVGLLLDTGHAYAAYARPTALIEKYHHRINLVHLKDIRKDILTQVKHQQMNFMAAVKAGMFTVPGDGCIDFENILPKLSHEGYQGWLVIEAEQDPQQANPLVYAQKAKHYLLNELNVGAG
jgi:inosose dehydratase